MQFTGMISPSVNLLTAFGFGIAGTLWFAFFGTDKHGVEKKQYK